MPFLQRPDGCRLYYELHGPEGGPPIVLLEGMGGDIPGWGPHLDGLARELRVVAYDFRGNGRSGPPGYDLSMGTLVADTVALLDHVRLDAAHVYGQSLGGMVALELALAHPERARSLILAATHPGRHAVVRTTARVPKDRPWEALFAAATVRDEPSLVRAHQRVARGNPQRPEARRIQWGAIQSFDAAARLGEIGVPVLVLHGTGDRMIHPDNARRLAEGIPGARLRLLDGAGHVYHWERPEESNRAVLEFVRGVGADTGPAAAR